MLSFSGLTFLTDEEVDKLLESVKAEKEAADARRRGGGGDSGSSSAAAATPAPAGVQ